MSGNGNTLSCTLFTVSMNRALSSSVLNSILTPVTFLSGPFFALTSDVRKLALSLKVEEDLTPFAGRLFTSAGQHSDIDSFQFDELVLFVLDSDLLSRRIHPPLRPALAEATAHVQ
jgi:hypothetical protein